MKINFTEAQKRAIEYGDGSLILSAAAGSGKTAALTERIAHLVLTGKAELTQMLVVTYTRAAAREMKNRLAARLGDLAEETRGADRDAFERISTALTQVASSDISTIHSFLLRVLRPRFPSLGIAPDARVGEARVLDVMRRETIRDVVNDCFERPEESTDEKVSFSELADVLGQVRDTESIDEQLLSLAERLEGVAAGREVLLDYAAALDGAADGFLSSSYGKSLSREVREMRDHYAGVFNDLGKEINSDPYLKEKYETVMAEINGWLEAVEIALGVSWDDLCHAAASYEKPARLPNLKKEQYAEFRERFKFFRDEFKKDVKDVIKPMTADTEVNASLACRRTAAILRRAADAIGEFDERLTKRKRTAGLLEYSDLERLALGLFLDKEMEPTDTAREVGRGYRYIFIDEFQDTNEVQDAIFRAISGNSIRFMVGDVKQSIYRFRGADPGVFSRYRDAWPKAGEDEQPGKGEGRSLFLSENFRCAQPVIDFVNAVSGLLLPEGDTPFGEEDRLIHARVEKDGFAPEQVELCLLRKIKKNKAEGAGAARTDEEGDGELTEEAEVEAEEHQEAAYVADRIAGMLGRYTSSGGRLKPGEVAILLRAPNTDGEAYEEALLRRGIPVWRKKGRPLGSFPSVLLLICLMNLADNPLRDIHTAGALRSPVFGFPLRELVKLREAAGEMPLYYGVLRMAGKTDGGRLSEKCAGLTDWQKRHHAVARSLPADKYLDYLIRDTDLFALPGIRDNGLERDAVNRLMALAKTYEDGARGTARFGGLAGFLEYLGETMEEEESEVSSGGDAVSILSIHSAKGLEYPVCFLSGCGKKRNSRDESETLLFDRALGVGPYLPDDGGLVRCNTLVRRAIAAKVRRESVSEEMRMLYVAMTRARDKLVVTGVTDNPEKFLEEASLQRDYTDGYSLRRAGNYLKWLVLACGEDALSWKVVGGPGADTAAADRTESPADGAEPIRTEEIADRFGFEYPDAFLSGVPFKLTVSRLYPGVLDEDEEADETFGAPKGWFGPGSAPAGTWNRKGPISLKRPRFMEGAGASGAEKGTATHTFLQFVDFSALNRDGYAAERDRLIREHFLSAGLAEMIDADAVERFRQSELFGKILRSAFLKREFRFIAEMEAERFSRDQELAEKLRAAKTKITVQGAVDCLFRDPDNGELVLIDYKTDRIPEGYSDEEADRMLLGRHRDQLVYYREICEAMFGEKIPTAAIYSVPLARTIPV